LGRAADLIRELKSKGYKITRQREAILKVLSSDECRLVTAQQIYEEVSKATPGTNFSTVYRNLEVLTQENIVQKIEINRDAAYYELAPDRDHHHHHLICKRYGSIKTTDFCPFEAMKDEDGFTPVEHRFEVYGYCKNCKQ